MYCATCRYDLSATRTPRCPECGRTFDPGDARTFISALPQRVARRRVARRRAEHEILDGCAIVLATAAGLLVTGVVLGLLILVS